MLTIRFLFFIYILLKKKYTEAFTMHIKLHSWCDLVIDSSGVSQLNTCFNSYKAVNELWSSEFSQHNDNDTYAGIVLKWYDKGKESELSSLFSSIGTTKRLHPRSRLRKSSNMKKCLHLSYKEVNIRWSTWPNSRRNIDLFHASGGGNMKEYSPC